MGETPKVIEFCWKLDNFCFCDFYSNRRLDSPVFPINTPTPSRWYLYMFPNGHGINKDVGIYLKRHKKDSGPRELMVRFKISLKAADGFLCPEAPPLERIFKKDCEWGHNEFIKRSAIYTGSVFLRQNSLNVVCQITNIEQNHQQLARRQPILQLGEDIEIINVYKALELLYKDKLHSDMILQGINQTFDTHRCILRARLPTLYNKLLCSPERVFSDDFMTEKTLLYAYTGKLDMKDLCHFNQNHLKTIFTEYGLLHLEKNIFSECNKYEAFTYFHIKQCSYSWKLPTVLMRENDEIYSTLINDGFRKTSFLICFFKNGDFWNIKIKPSSSNNDDVFVRCRLSVKDILSEDTASETFESLCRSNSWWLYPTSMRSENNDLVFKGLLLCSRESEFFNMDFVLIYPSGRHYSDLESATSSHASTTEYIVDDIQKLLQDFEELYRNPSESDFTVLVGKKEFNIHKGIICARSPYFRAMLEHDTLEKRENKVQLKNDDLDENTFQEVMDKVLLFAYCGKFEARSPTFANLLLKAIDMYMIGKD